MTPTRPRSLFAKYLAAFVAVVALPLALHTGWSLWRAQDEHRQQLEALLGQHAASAALRIAGFVREIEAQLAWATHLEWTDDPGELARRRLDALRLLRQVPAVTDLRLVDGEGRVRFTVSRLALNRDDVREDLARDERFTGAVEQRVRYGPVYFRRETEPFMTLSVAGPRRESGVVIAEVNLKHIWEVVSAIRVGRTGLAYVVDADDRLIAHPDISLVLRNTRLAETPSDGLSAEASASPLRWRVVATMPRDEADAPLRSAIVRALLAAAAGLALAIAFAFLLASRMARPIRTLAAGAAELGAGRLDHRIHIASGDELEALGRRFNAMAGDLQASYAELEEKVDRRTRELAAANQAMSRFVAAASHDLRQPLHALNLLVAQLTDARTPAERDRLTARIGMALAAMNDLFGSLLDISRLDAGAVQPAPVAVALARVLARVETAVAPAAAAKGLRFHVVPTRTWTRSDPVLLERVLLNLATNAVRYTAQGGVVIGVRRRADGGLRLDVADSGIGIPGDQTARIFGEFFQGTAPRAMQREGLGLGLAIVARLCTLLGHAVEVRSVPGRGSRFSVALDRVPPGAAEEVSAPSAVALADPLRGKHVLVIDNDALVLESTAGLLRSWGCDVASAATRAEACARSRVVEPDLVIADFHLDDGAVGTEVIAHLRERFGPTPAIVVSGDVSGTPRRAAEESGLVLLEKPLNPMRLRAVATALLAE